MESGPFTKPPKKSSKPPRVAREETTNREGRWVRDFSVRTEMWPIVEQWAADQGFHLTAAKGQSRRMYQKGYDNLFFTPCVDIRYGDGRVVMSSWINVTFRARAIHLFTLPSELEVDPSGYKAASYRRELCRDLNVLLMRVRQPLIMGSTGLHPADLDLTSRLLAVILSVATVLFLGLTAARLEVRPGLSPALFQIFGTTLGYLAAAGAVLFLLHQFVTLRFAKERLWKFVAMGVTAVLHGVATIVFFTMNASGMQSQKVTYYCVQSYSAEKCRKALDGLSTGDRAKVLERLHLVEQELSRQNPKP